MKVVLIQPEYSTDFSESEEFFARELRLLDSADASADLIVLPESADTPCLARTPEEREIAFRRFNAPLLEAAKNAARRCGAMVFVNARSVAENGLLRNTTFAFDRRGREAGRYFKRHLTPKESAFLDSSYSAFYSPAPIVEMEGLRIGFLTCYDFYFYEAVSQLARQKPDLVIGCSHQRTDTKTALEMFSSFVAYNTGAYLLRASVSMGEGSALGGCSLIASPAGEILLDMESRVGTASLAIDPFQKYLKPAGFGNPPASHADYVEQGRRPWLYRPAGPGTVPGDEKMPYPRICAHRGAHGAAPENSLPAYGAAVAMGADEIEFDLWETRDGEIVSLHDSRLERVSDGEGRVWEHTLAELKELDFGEKSDPYFKGLRLPAFEEILQKFPRRTVMNIHVKGGEKTRRCSEKGLKKIVDLLYAYDCAGHAYFMTGDEPTLDALQRLAPEIPRCCGVAPSRKTLLERAARYGCKKIQLFCGKNDPEEVAFDPELIRRAKEAGLRVNACPVNSEELAKRLLRLGVDTLLTDRFPLLAPLVRGERE